LPYTLIAFVEATDEASGEAQVVDSGYPRTKKGWIFPVQGYPALIFHKSRLTILQCRQRLLMRRDSGRARQREWRPSQCREL
jgi:hypothetical protein